MNCVSFCLQADACLLVESVALPAHLVAGVYLLLQPGTSCGQGSFDRLELSTSRLSTQGCSKAGFLGSGVGCLQLGCLLLLCLVSCMLELLHLWRRHSQRKDQSRHGEGICAVWL